MNRRDSRRSAARPAAGSAAYLAGRGTELVERLLDIADEDEARAVIAEIASEGSGLYEFLLKSWREGYVTL
jgi:hypothetical protein